MTFSHHMASVNGVQIHDAIGGLGTLETNTVRELV